MQRLPAGATRSDSGGSTCTVDNQLRPRGLWHRHCLEACSPSQSCLLPPCLSLTSKQAWCCQLAAERSTVGLFLKEKKVLKQRTTNTNNNKQTNKQTPQLGRVEAWQHFLAGQVSPETTVDVTVTFSTLSCSGFGGRRWQQEELHSQGEGGGSPLIFTVLSAPTTQWLLLPVAPVLLSVIRLGKPSPGTEQSRCPLL